MTAVSHIVFAQFPNFNVNYFGDVQGLANLIMGGPVDSNLLRLPNIFYFIIFPFISVVTIIYGIMSDIRIFRSQNIRIVLSLMMAAISLPSGGLLTLVVLFFTFGAWLAVGAFGVLFIIGIGLWFYGRTGEMKHRYYDMLNEINRLKNESGQLDLLYSQGKIKRPQYMKKKEDLILRYKDLEARIQTLSAFSEATSGS